MSCTSRSTLDNVFANLLRDVCCHVTQLDKKGVQMIIVTKYLIVLLKQKSFITSHSLSRLFKLFFIASKNKFVLFR